MNDWPEATTGFTGALAAGLLAKHYLVAKMAVCGLIIRCIIT